MTQRPPSLQQLSTHRKRLMRCGAPGSSGKNLNTEVLAVAPSQAVHNAVQEGKIQSARQIIREHVRASDPKLAHIFPVKNSKITLSSAEVESFKADYQTRKKFPRRLCQHDDDDCGLSCAHGH